MQSGYAPVNGLGMYYEIHGAGRPVVLLHGAFSGIGASFGAIAPALAERRQVIGVEFQGHARTADIVGPEHAVETFRLLGGGVNGDIVGPPTSRLAVLPGTTHTGVAAHGGWLAPTIDDFLESQTGAD